MVPSAAQALTGTHRQQVAENLWAAWQEAKRSAAIITGVSGTGKTDRLVRPLIQRAQQQSRIAVLVDVPETPLSLDAELCSRVINELKDAGETELALECEKLAGFSAVARSVLKCGALLVLDEFQRLLEPASAQPLPEWRTAFQKLATRAVDNGCLWLVSNREISPEWTESFHVAALPAPASVEDQLSIVFDSLTSEDADIRFPAARQGEIVGRLGGNPRALRLLGNLLRTHALDDMLGPAQPTPDRPPDPALVSALEGRLVKRAAADLSPRAKALLGALTVLPAPAPRSLIEAVSGTSSAEVGSDVGELQSRYLLNATVSRYIVHPVAREVLGPQLRARSEDWKQTNLRAGRWHASALQFAINRSIQNADLALRLSDVRYHLLNAEAHDELRTALEPVREYVTANFGWTARKITTASERDGAIGFLEAFLTKPAAPGVEFTCAKLLWSRDHPGDAERALPHAERATRGQDFHIPWLLWAKLVRESEGIEAGARAAKKGITAVKPEKSLFALYKFLGICLIHLGLIEDAIDALLEGAEASIGNEARLLETAIQAAASTAGPGLLLKIKDFASARQAAFHGQLAWADIALLEQQGCWQDAAALAARTRRDYPNYLLIGLHEVLSRLGAGDPRGAAAAISTFPPIREEARTGDQWLLALVAACNADLPTAAKHYCIYAEIAEAPSTITALQAALLRDWDHHVGTVGEGHPAVTFPILPKTVTGTSTDARRPQYGPPVLLQHAANRAGPAPANSEKELAILALATEWQSGRGGLTTLNRNLCLALARQGAKVVCVVEPRSGHTTDEDGVHVIVAKSTPGMDPHDALLRKPDLPAEFSPDIIIGHGRVTGPAAKTLTEDHFPAARRLHFVHMSPDEIEWLKPGRADDSGMRAEERTQMELELAQGASLVVAVGPRLYGRFLRDLEAAQLQAPVRLDPGFDYETSPDRVPPSGQPWAVLVMGRMEDAELKGLDIASQAMGQIAKVRRVTQNLELIVRGAPEGASNETKEKVDTWASCSSLSVLVRPYTVNSERLDADLRRASLVLMPSRAEGFGLVGLEAILAGTPVLVSERSGLGQLLQEVLSKEQAARHVISVTGTSSVDAESWSRAAEAILIDREAAFRRAAELRSEMAKQRTWASAIGALLAELMLPVLR